MTDVQITISDYGKKKNDGPEISPWILILSRLLGNCGLLSRLLNFCGPHCPHLQHGCLNCFGIKTERCISQCTEVKYALSGTAVEVYC